MTRDAILFEKMDDNKVKCTACARYCEIKKDQIGLCGIRGNENGKLQLYVYGKVITEVSLRSTKKNVEDVLPYSVERVRQELELPSGGVIDMGPLRGDFFLDEVQTLSALDKKGEFYVVVVSEDGKEEKFKIKSKHFKQLP